MNNIVTCSLLIDDDKATNFFNKYLLLKHNAFENINVIQSAKDALEYLKNNYQQLDTKPELIFLDINMPAMNGWEFLIEFSKLDPNLIDGIKVILLSTSSNPDDVKESAKNHSVDDFINKPLSRGLLDDVLKDHFQVPVDVS